MHSFLAILHVGSGILALLSGIPAMLSQKGSVTHRNTGLIYFFSLLLCGITGIVMSLSSGNLILLLISFFTLYMALSGKLYGRLHQNRNARLAMWIRDTAAFGTLISGALILVGLYLLFSNTRWIYLVPIVFGGILLSLAILDLYHLRNTTIPTSRQIILLHISRMGGSYIAAVTAFLVNQVHIGPAVLWWLLPGIVGGWIIRNVSARFSRTNQEA